MSVFDPEAFTSLLAQSFVQAANEVQDDSEPKPNWDELPDYERKELTDIFAKMREIFPFGPVINVQEGDTLMFVVSSDFEIEDLKRMKEQVEGVFDGVKVVVAGIGTDATIIKGRQPRCSEMSTMLAGITEPRPCIRTLGHPVDIKADEMHETVDGMRWAPASKEMADGEA